jgi:RNA polymerase sigma factor (sigma-70 family)
MTPNPSALELRRLVAADGHGPGDAELLHRFASTGDPEAFEVLVRRHAQTVLGACRRVLGDAHTAEDAFQATFLQLARNAGRVHTSLAGWLYRTARRTALRQRLRVRNSTPHSAFRIPHSTDPLDALTARELLAAIEDEIARLPEAYRLPLVLCYLDGLAKSAAADRLGLAPGVLRGRLDRGRARLRAALARRGLAPAVAAGLLVPAAGPAAAELLARTVAICVGGEPASAAVAALAAGRAGFVGKAVLVAGLTVFAGGVVLLAAGRTEPPSEPEAVATKAAAPPPRLDAYGDPLPPDALARMGTVRWRHHEENGNQLYLVPSPDGKRVATAAVGVGVIRVYDLSDGRRLCEIPWGEDRAGYEVGFTPDGARVFYLAERGVVRYFDPATGKPTGETKPVVEQDVPDRVRGNPDKWNEQHTRHTLTRDGRWILTAHPVDGRFTLLLTEIAPDTAAKPRQFRPEGPAEYRNGIEIYEYICEGTTLIGAGRDWKRKPRGPAVFRWDLASGKLTDTTPIAVQENGFDLSQDGKRLVTWQGGLRVWDTQTGAEAVRLEGPTNAGYGTRFSADGKKLTAAVMGKDDAATATATVWELDHGRVVGRVEMPRRYEYTRLLPDGKTLLAAGRGLMFGTWDLSTGRRLGPIAGHEDGLHHIEFSKDGATLLTASRDRHERISAWNAASGEKLRDLSAPSGWAGFVPAPGGLATADRGNELVWADTTTGRELRRVETGGLAADLGGPAAYFELSPCLDPQTGRPAVFGLVTEAHNRRKVVARWDAASGALLAHRPFPLGNYDRFLAVSPDGRLIARETCDLPDNNRGGTSVADMLGHQAIVLEDAATGALLLRLNQPDYLMGTRAIAFTPDGQAFATWTSTYPDDGKKPGVNTVRLWELRSGKQRLAIPLPVVGSWWEFEPQAIAMSADGRFFAAARHDKTIAVLDLATGAEVARRSGCGTVVTCLSFRHDGKALASGHADGTAVVWDLSGLSRAKAAPADREAAWARLASGDAGEAYRAMLVLVADPGSGAFVRDRVKPVAAVPADRVRQLIVDLDSPQFATREKATTELAKYGDSADEHLHSALRENVSAEQRQRIEGILGKRKLAEPDPDRLRTLRCVEVLERSGSPESRAVLAGMAKGAAGARLTREAAAALRRIEAGP